MFELASHDKMNDAVINQLGNSAGTARGDGYTMHLGHENSAFGVQADLVTIRPRQRRSMALPFQAIIRVKLTRRQMVAYKINNRLDSDLASTSNHFSGEKYPSATHDADVISDGAGLGMPFQVCC